MGAGGVFPGVVEGFCEFLEADGGGAESGGAVAADLGNDLVVEVADEAVEFFLGAAGGFLETLIERLLVRS